ncbi:MAG: DNA repair protein RecN [Woeseiaceae bacterium]|nr:DNA repair protein RecN [Woeseiaceae bacterium]
MLTGLQIRDFAIIDRIEVDFGDGMTVLTGETGAGKSILVDALGLVLGDRGGQQLVRNGAKRAEFSAEFDISSLPDVRRWLDEQSLDEDDACFLRRVIGADGRSRAYINGNAVAVQQLRTIGEMLLDIHGQHFHQSLAKRKVQRELLDHYGGLLDARAQTEVAFAEWQSVEERLQNLLDADADRASKLDLLQFQLGELDSLSAHEGEFEALHAERQVLANSGRIAEGVNSALDELIDSDDGNANSTIAEAMRNVDRLVDVDPQLQSVCELLESASIQVTEAADTLRRYGDSIEMDPARRDQVEERLDALHATARKHRVEPAELPALQQRLRDELDELTHAEERGRELEAEVLAKRQQFLKLAAELSNGRKVAAQRFAREITEAMSGLGMPGGKFDVSIRLLEPDDARSWGVDDVEFVISANPGQALQPLSKVASGGELSRMSLAVQVIASGGSDIPTMVFDEVDSGVGGGVAEMVGRRLQELGDSRQVLCVTHLPQVASLADRHFRISKVSDGSATRTGIQQLDTEERTQELARMLGGVEITRKTLEHAAEMLAGGSRRRA